MIKINLISFDCICSRKFELIPDPAKPLKFVGRVICSKNPELAIEKQVDFDMRALELRRIE